MALQSSGQISLNDIRLEQSRVQVNVRLGTMSDDAGFSAPDQISDFYGYTHSSLQSMGALGYNLKFSSTACGATSTDDIWSDGSLQITVGDVFYTDAAGNSKAPKGYYSDEDDWGRITSTTSGYVSSTGFCD